MDSNPVKSAFHQEFVIRGAVKKFIYLENWFKYKCVTGSALFNSQSKLFLQQLILWIMQTLMRPIRERGF